MTHPNDDDGDQLEATSTFVKNALEDLAIKGPDAAMYRLIEKNIRKRSDLKLTKRLYLAVTHHVTQVVSNKTGAHDSLIDAVFSFDFIVNDIDRQQEFDDTEKLRDAFGICAMALVSAKATLAAPCLRMLIKSLQSFCYSSGINKSGSINGLEQLDCSELTQENDSEVTMRRRIVSLVLRVVKLVPTAGPSLVGPLLAEHFPHRFRHVHCLRCYVRGVLQIANELPRISSDLIALLVERCLEIDVEIKLDDATGTAKLIGVAESGGGAAESYEESDDEDAINLLGFGSPIAVNTGSFVNYISVTPSSMVRKDNQLSAPVAVDEMAEKLDMLMLELFEHIDEAMAVVSVRHAEGDHRGVKEISGRLWNAIHGTFQAKILLTHRSKFVQFLLLRFCALQPEYSLIFSSSLESMCVDRMVPHVRRTNAVHFLASFMVRTRSLPLTSIATSSTRLLVWVVSQLPVEEEQHRLRSQNKSLSKDGHGQAGIAAGLLDPSDLANHRLGVLYSISQALFYIICFKGSAFSSVFQSQEVERSSLIELMNPSMWMRLCQSPLQPLAYCLERVRVEFLGSARRLKLLPKEDSYHLGLKAEETLKALSSMAGLGLTQSTPIPGGGGKYPSTPRSLTTSSSDVDPRTPSSRRSDNWSAPIRTPASSLSSSSVTPKTPKSKQTVSSVSGTGEFNRSNPLDSFFPFDPYLLRNSFRFVADIYCDWEPCYIDDEEDNDEQEFDFDKAHDALSDDDEEDDVSEDSDGSRSASDSLDTNSFFRQGSESTSVATSYGSHSAMSLDSAPASPVDVQAPSLLARLDSESRRMHRQTDELFDNDDEEEEGEEEEEEEEEPNSYHEDAGGLNDSDGEYESVAIRRRRADSIGDW